MVSFFAVLNYVHYFCMFTLREQQKNVNMKELEIIQTAIQNLEQAPDFYANWKAIDDAFRDGILTIIVRGNEMKFDVQVRQELRFYQLNDIINKIETDNKLMIVAAKIFPTIKEHLREKNIAYLEANGNLYINNEGATIWLDGNKPLQEIKNDTNRAFTKTGIKTIFNFLLDENLINRTQRQIAETVNIGLGNINVIFKGLKELGFLAKINKNELKLLEKNKLLEKWIEAYQEKLQPDLKIGTFRFLKEDQFVNWRKTQLNEMKTYWGGEPAGNILTNYLRPEELTLYTLENKQELMKNYRLIPDEKGNVRAYKKFWHIEANELNIVPAILVYADLINKNDTRCTETARIIYDTIIKENI